jgi:hypothetical protein
MKKDNITEDKKRIKCLIVAKKMIEKRKERERNGVVKEEKERRR